MRAILTCLWVALLLSTASSTWAHPVELGVLRVTEDVKGEVVASLSFSGSEERPGQVAPTIAGCDAPSETASDARVVVFRCPGGLEGREIAVAGLLGRDGEVVLEVSRASGAAFRVMLDGDHPGHVVAALPGRSAWFVGFVASGIEHVLFGFDHVLFVLGLVMLVRARRQLLLVVTSFTVGHSITLALASLEILTLPRAPVEAAIAASLIVVAGAIAERHDDAPRWLAVSTLAFGLLHGLGFAGALRPTLSETAGLPPMHSFIALAGFNVGVEIAQVMAIGATLLVIAAANAAATRAGLRASWGRRAVAYAMGAVAVFWYLERFAAVLHA